MAMVAPTARISEGASGPKAGRALALLASLFFMWGFITVINGTLLPHLRSVFALMLFGVFMPMQVVLLPMSQVLGWLGIASSIWGLVLVHVVAGLPQLVAGPLDLGSGELWRTVAVVVVAGAASFLWGGINPATLIGRTLGRDVTRAGYNQGYALRHTPTRGEGAIGPAVKPGWKTQEV